ncbi:MAG: thiamine phosphate synthase [Verrucomicrobia bacterium]|nr:thiamine phosphate synthase [Verrucomicrobiota bacterium]
MNLLSSYFLYGIVDLGYVVPDRVATVTTRLIDGGIDILQLRAKQRSKAEIVRFAEAMLPITRGAGVPLILNDHPDLLRDVDADGCHVGQEDLGVDAVRDLVQRSCIIGKSTHSLAEALAAEKEGADYIGFGPLFPTATKPDAKPIGLSDIRAVHQQVRVPIFCIGGIKLDNLPGILLAGCKRVCIVSELLLASDVAKRTREVKSVLVSQA